MNDIKICARCEREYSKPPKVGRNQWAAREYCSRSCAAKKSDIDIAEAHQLYIGGCSSTELAPLYGTSRVHLIRLFKAHGLEIKTASVSKRQSHAKPSTKAKLRLANLGRKHSPEAIKKLKDLAGEKSPNWRGGITMVAGGYLAYTNSIANGENAGKYVHRSKFQKHIGRPLRSDEHVHHKDGDKLNNDIDNLELMSASDHAKHHTKDREAGKLAHKIAREQSTNG